MESPPAGRRQPAPAASSPAVIDFRDAPLRLPWLSAAAQGLNRPSTPRAGRLHRPHRLRQEHPVRRSSTSTAPTGHGDGRWLSVNRKLEPQSLRRQIGYVPQDVVLFHGDIRENILSAAPRPGDEQPLEPCACPASTKPSPRCPTASAPRSAANAANASRRPAPGDLSITRRWVLSRACCSSTGHQRKWTRPPKRLIDNLRSIRGITVLLVTHHVGDAAAGRPAGSYSTRGKVVLIGLANPPQTAGRPGPQSPGSSPHEDQLPAYPAGRAQEFKPSASIDFERGPRHRCCPARHRAVLRAAVRVDELRAPRHLGDGDAPSSPSSAASAGGAWRAASCRPQRPQKAPSCAKGRRARHRPEPAVQRRAGRSPQRPVGRQAALVRARCRSPRHHPGPTELEKPTWSRTAQPVADRRQERENSLEDAGPPARPAPARTGQGALTRRRPSANPSAPPAKPSPIEGKLGASGAGARADLLAAQRYSGQKGELETTRIAI